MDPESLPDNKVQDVRRLETTERCLVNNPEVTNAYQQQIEEMKLKFACKLADVEIKDYKCPVHYVFHNEVLRPTSGLTRRAHHLLILSKGHCLNDYWMKGPDLLNCLFGPR